MSSVTVINRFIDTNEKYLYPVKVFILLGQSNADGRGAIVDLPAQYLTPQSGRYIYYKPTVGSTDDGSWQVLQGGVNNQNPTDAPIEFGLEMTMMEALQQICCEDIYLIKYGQGSTCMADNGGTFNPNVASVSDCWLSTANELITRSLDWYVAPAIAKLQEMEIPYEICGVIWYQGECDSTNATNAGNYQTNMINFINALRSHPSINLPNLPFIDFQVVPGGGSTAVINAAKNAIAASQPDKYKFMPTTGYPYDGVHLSGDGYLMAGEDAATALHSFMV